MRLSTLLLLATLLIAGTLWMFGTFVTSINSALETGSLYSEGVPRD